MPSKTAKQAKLMRAAAHGWKMPGGGGPSVAVAKEFVREDKKKKRQFGKMAEVNTQDVRHGKLDLPTSHPKAKKRAR